MEETQLIETLPLWLKVSLGILALAAGVASVLKVLLELRKIKAEMREIRVVVSDTEEMRTALRKPMEGVWKMNGTFTKYRSVASLHYTRGELHLAWVPLKGSYDALYYYSVQKPGEPNDLITCICRGTMGATQYGMLHDEQDVDIDLEIAGRSARAGYDHPHARAFLLRDGKVTRRNGGTIIQMQFAFRNGETEGTMTFSR